MSNFKFTVKEIITISTMFVIIGSAWATSQSDIREVVHSVKENKERMIRIERRTLRQFRAILKAIKKVELEAS